MALPTFGEITAALERIGPGMLVVAVGSTIALGLAGLVVLLMRRSSGSARYEVWMLGFVGVLVLPVLSAMLPGWRVRHGTDGGVEARQPAGLARNVASEVPATSTPPDLRFEFPLKAERPASRIQDPPTSNHRANTTPAPVSVQQSSATVTRSPARVVSPGGVRWTVWAAVCWGAGFLLVLVRVMLGHLSLKSLERRCAKVGSGEMFALLEGLRRELGIRRRVELLSSPARTMPMTWGLWRPRLLVPRQCVSWPVGQRRDVLLHELGHVKRWDCLTQCIAQLACAVYWFNPLAWVASRRMQVERERACDDLVLSRGTDAASYARHLLQSVSPIPWPRLAVAAVAMATSTTLEERMRAILDPRVSRRGLSRMGATGMVLLLMTSLVPMAALKAQQAPPENRGSGPTTRPGGFGGGGGFGGRGGVRGGFGGGGGAMPAQSPTLGEGPTCTFDATIYDVRVPVDQIGRLDVDALSRAGETAEGFEKALFELGATKPMYRAHQSVRLGGDVVIISSQVPIVTSNTVTANGQTVSSYTYQNVGAHFNVAGRSAGPASSELDLSIQVSSTSDTGTMVGPGVMAPVMRSATRVHKGSFQPKKPFVVVSVDAGATDKDGKAVAYIARVIVGEPESRGAR